MSQRQGFVTGRKRERKHYRRGAEKTEVGRLGGKRKIYFIKFVVLLCTYVYMGGTDKCKII